MRMQISIVLTSCLMFAAVADAQMGGRQNLKVGDEAPSLNVAEWVQGDAVTFGPDRVVVVNFWATWCGPCKRAMPRLNELYNQYADDGLVIVGMNFEEKEDTVRSFLRTPLGGQLDYPVAVDENSQTKRAWMDAANRSGIPVVFIVDQRGRIQYIGHPLADEFVPILQQVMTGRYDARLSEKARPLVNAANRAREMRNWHLALRHYDEIIEIDRRVFAPYALVKFEVLLMDMDDRTAAYQYARQLINQYADDELFLADLARAIARDPNLDDDKRDLSVAKAAAERAVAKTNRSDPRMLAALAVVEHERGNYSEAVSLQRRAWMIASPNRKPAYERILRGYQESQTRASR